MRRMSTSPTSTWGCPTPPPVSTAARTTSPRKRRPHGKPPSAGTTSTQSSGSPRFERAKHQSSQSAAVPLPPSPRSVMGIQPVAIERCSDLAEPLGAQLAPVWELVASIPAPGCDHRQHEDPALPEQALIDTPIV